MSWSSFDFTRVCSSRSPKERLRNIFSRHQASHRIHYLVDGALYANELDNDTDHNNDDDTVNDNVDDKDIDDYHDINDDYDIDAYHDINDDYDIDWNIDDYNSDIDNTADGHLALSSILHPFSNSRHNLGVRPRRAKRLHLNTWSKNQETSDIHLWF